MPNLSERATAAEIIDDPANLTAPEMQQVLRELELVNRWLGGTSASLKAVAAVLCHWDRPGPHPYYGHRHGIGRYSPRPGRGGVEGATCQCRSSPLTRARRSVCWLITT